MYSGDCYCCNGQEEDSNLVIEDLNLTLEEDEPKPKPAGIRMSLKKTKGNWIVV